MFYSQLLHACLCSCVPSPAQSRTSWHSCWECCRSYNHQGASFWPPPCTALGALVPSRSADSLRNTAPTPPSRTLWDKSDVLWLFSDSKATNCRRANLVYPSKCPARGRGTLPPRSRALVMLIISKASVSHSLCKSCFISSWTEEGSTFSISLSLMKNSAW